MYLPILLAAILTIIHNFAGSMSSSIERYHHHLLSFSSGLFLSILLLFIIPEISNLLRLEELLFAILIGIVLFHVAEKYLYQHITHKKELLKDLGELHMLGFFIDHFIIGFIIVLVFSNNITLSFIVLIPFILHTLSSAVALTHIVEHFNNKLLKIALSLSTLIGAVVASIIPLGITAGYLYAIGTGVLLYISMRDMIPNGRKGMPALFFLGVLISIAIIFIL